MTRIGRIASRIFGIGCIGLLGITAPKHFKVPVRPIENRIVRTFADTAKPKNILVIDGFKKNHVQIDADWYADIPHGYLVSKIIETGLPNANVYKKNLPITDKEYSEFTNSLFNEIRSGKKYDAVNLSCGMAVDFDLISKNIGETISAENIMAKARQVKDFFIKHPNTTISYTDTTLKAKNVMKFINCMDSLSANGAKIYVSGGNSYNFKLNLLSLIDNSISVGSLDKHSDTAYYSAKNSLVSRWEKDCVSVKRVKDGYSVDTGFDSFFINKKNTTGLFHIPRFKNIKGTSFSTPRALVKDMQ